MGAVGRLGPSRGHLAPAANPVRHRGHTSSAASPLPNADCTEHPCRARPGALVWPISTQSCGWSCVSFFVVILHSFA